MNPRQNEVLILGGYGNFGKRICHGLAHSGVPVIIAGRRIGQAEALAQEIRQAYPAANARARKRWT